MNGDTIDWIARFLEREEPKVPERVSNTMILLALREERDARKREISEVLQKVNELLVVLNGKEGRPTEGMLYRLTQLSHFRDVMVRALSAVVLAFLGGLGMYLFNLLAK
ncbi:MAG: hypothetical protein P8046_15310 [Anaerolineales bacterium]